MTTFYLDFEGGNDANDGLTFANRWKTLTSGATAARTAPGDTIRVMASPDPVSLGSATWTDDSGLITWAVAKNTVIDNCNSGWVASTNVTATYTTPQKEGTGRLNLAFAAGFTTGLAAYKTLPAPLDLSTFEQISFWFQTSTGNPNFTVALCSDTLGAVPIDSFAFVLVSGTDLNNNTWKMTVGDKAAALGAVINSVAIYVDVDPSTASWRFDNIVACKAAGSADEITHKLIIGKNTAGEPEWYNIGVITDTGVEFGGSINTSGPSADPAMPYRGATESVTTYKRYCILHGTSVQSIVQESGTSGSPITYSGGWNRTDMSTQTGETWISGELPTIVSLGSANTYINTEKFGFANFSGFGVSGVNGFQIHDFVGFVGCAQIFGAATYTAGQTAAPVVTVDHTWGTNAGILGTFSRPLDLAVRLIQGDCDSTSNSGAFSGTSGYGVASKYDIKRIENNRSNGVYNAGAHNLKFRGTTFKNNLISDIRFSGTTYNKVELEDCELLSATPITNNTTTALIEVYETRIGGDPLVNKITNTFSYYQSQAITTHSGSIAWEMGFLTAVNFWIEQPAEYPLLSVACNAGTLVTVKAWLRRDNAGVGAGLRILENPVQGITETTVWMTAAIDTWEEVTLTFTPTTSGVFDILAVGYGPVGNLAFFDGDVTVTQA